MAFAGRLTDINRERRIQRLKRELARCPESEREEVLGYGRNGGKRTVEDATAMDVVAVVDEIPADKLDWAMQQVQRTVAG